MSNHWALANACATCDIENTPLSPSPSYSSSTSPHHCHRQRHHAIVSIAIAIISTTLTTFILCVHTFHTLPKPLPCDYGLPRLPTRGFRQGERGPSHYVTTEQCASTNPASRQARHCILPTSTHTGDTPVHAGSPYPGNCGSSCRSHKPVPRSCRTTAYNQATAPTCLCCADS